MRRGVAVAALVLAGIVWVTPDEVVVLRFVYSPDAAPLLEPKIEAFNAAYTGEIEVLGEDISSGSALSGILGGSQEPDLWMPAASTWVSLLNFRSPTQIAPTENLSFFWSPEVIAVWDEMRDAIEGSDELGEVGWEGLVALSTGEITFEDLDPDSELDPFRLGHTKPTRSTSGLYALVSEFALAAGPGGLSVDSVTAPASRHEVADIEGSIVHYGDIADDFCPLLAEHRSQYVSALYLQETTLLRCIGDNSLGGLSSVIPAGGTYVADYPLVELQAPWTAESREEASVFVSWLGEHIAETDTRALCFRFGSATDRATPEPPCGEAPPESEIVPLPPPDGAILDEIQTAWLELRKRANVLLVLDRSAHMQGLEDDSRDLVCDLVGVLGDEAHGADPDNQDRVGLDIFDVDVEQVVPLGAIGTVEDDICDAAGGIARNSSDVVLLDAIDDALRPPLGEQSAIDLVVVIASGEERTSETTMEALEHRIETLAELRSPVQVVTVSFVSPAQLLVDISNTSRTRSFLVTDADSIDDIARDLAALV